MATLKSVKNITRNLKKDQQASLSGIVGRTLEVLSIDTETKYLPSGAKDMHVIGSLTTKH